MVAIGSCQKIRTCRQGGGYVGAFCTFCSGSINKVVLSMVCAVMVSISGVLPVLHGAVCLTLPAIGNLVSAMHHDGLVRAIFICLCG
jgi:hypothetical protein